MNPPQITHERVDDIPVILQVLRERLTLDQILDEQMPPHGNWQGLSVGGVTVTWLTHILTECDHFMSQALIFVSATGQQPCGIMSTWQFQPCHFWWLTKGGRPKRRS
jgi:hypothetical protein